jgi:hypothetical protein
MSMNTTMIDSSPPTLRIYQSNRKAPEPVNGRILLRTATSSGLTLDSARSRSCGEIGYSLEGLLSIVRGN